MNKIVSVREHAKDECYISVQKIGGATDGETFTSMIATLDDGREITVYKSNIRSGYFLSAFVPFGFRHKKVIF